MNVGPASTVWSAQGGIDLAAHSNERPLDSGARGSHAAREGNRSGTRAVGSKDGMDARIVLQLLKDGRVSSVADERLRASVREAAKTSAGQADTIGRTPAGDDATERRDPLRDLLHTGLFDKAMQTMLAEVFTQSRAEAETALGSEEVIDAEQLYEEMKETFEEFHASLKRIFRLVDGPKAEEGEASSGSVAAGEARAEDTAADRAEAVQEELVERIVAAYQEMLDEAPSAAEAEEDGGAKDEGGAYARLTAAYEARYEPSSGGERSSFSTEG